MTDCKRIFDCLFSYTKRAPYQVAGARACVKTDRTDRPSVLAVKPRFTFEDYGGMFRDNKVLVRVALSFAPSRSRSAVFARWGVVKKKSPITGVVGGLALFWFAVGVISLLAL
jgi:hypothetical protein